MMRITKQTHGQILVLALSGKMDTAAADRVQKSLLESVRDAQGQVILDASNLKYISSTGLRILFLAAQERPNPADRIAICGLNERLRDIFVTTGFTDIFTMHESLREALAAMEEAQ